MSLHENLRLYISADTYWLVASGETGESLRIDRGSNHISKSPTSTPPSTFEKEIQVYGLFGIISLLQCTFNELPHVPDTISNNVLPTADYLIVITKRTKSAAILSTPIYRAKDFSVFPINRASTKKLLSNPIEAYLLGLIKAHLYSGSFYYTYGGYNITCRLQGQVSQSMTPLLETTDDRFFWNRHLQRRLIDTVTGNAAIDCSRFILPVMFGFFHVKNTAINGRHVQFGLISRRNRFRAGTRYFSRGIDRDGNVSNFNETEQILLLDAQTGSHSGEIQGDIKFSFIQTRGSVPVYWAEINNLRYKPDLKIMDIATTHDSLSRHFNQQVSIYGDQYLVNLVNKSGYEKPVKEAYEKALDTMGNSRLHYTYFDFHHECKGLRFDRVSVLIDGLDEELHQQGYFFHDTKAAPLRPQRIQSSVVRTNCMDCLDRTNVVQSALGKWVLNNQLRQVGILSMKESIEEHAAFLNVFRNLWADNADAVSKAYSGTGALKTDYTRTGKRSKEGALQDGINSIVRYIKNNFLDGSRQDAYDLVTGTWSPLEDQQQNWQDTRDPLTRLAPLLLTFALILISIVIMAPLIVSDYVVSSQKVFLLSLTLAAFAVMHMMKNGIEYVAWPKLVRLDEVINYSGKGFESGRRGRPLKHAGAEGSAKRSAIKDRKESILPMLGATADAKRD